MDGKPPLEPTVETRAQDARIDSPSVPARPGAPEEARRAKRGAALDRGRRTPLDRPSERGGHDQGTRIHFEDVPPAQPSRSARSKLEPAAASPDFVDRLIARDEAAFEELVRLHGPRMLAVATRYLPRAADAEDVLQEAFVNVVRAISGFQRASSIETWLHRIVVNCALMSLRSKRRKPLKTLEESTLDAGGASPWRRWPLPSAHEVIANEEMRQTVRRSVDGLPEPQRCVLLLRDVEGLEMKAIAELLGIGISTVKIRLHRARHALQTTLGPRLSETHA